MNDLFSTDISIEERTEKKHHDYQCNVSIGKKEIYSLKKLKTCKIKKKMYLGYRMLSNFSPYIEFYNNEVSFRNTKK